MYKNAKSVLNAAWCVAFSSLTLQTLRVLVNLQIPPGSASVLLVLNSSPGDRDESIVLILLPVELPATVGLKI